MQRTPFGLLPNMLPRFRLTTFLVCIELILQPVSVAQSNPPLTHEIPLWTARPEQVGYDVARFKVFSFSKSNNLHPLVGGDVVKIQFLDSDLLALAWLAPDEIVKKPLKRGTTIPSQLHLSILGAKTGRQVSKHEWACSSRGANLAYTAAGQWLISSDESVTLYSSSFEKIRDLQGVRPPGGRAFVSPTGRSFMLYAPDSNGAWVPQIRDSATFEILDSWDNGRFTMGFVYSDRYILAEAQKPLRLFKREFGDSWSPFSPPLDSAHPLAILAYSFLNDDTLVNYSAHELIVETINAKEFFRQTTSGKDLFVGWWSTSTISAGGKRLAVILDRMKGPRNDFLDVYPYPANDRVMVYDLHQRSAVFSVKVKGPSPWDPNDHWNRIAISPDGLLLGIVSNEGVEVYALPPNQPRIEATPASDFR